MESWLRIIICVVFLISFAVLFEVDKTNDLKESLGAIAAITIWMPLLALEVWIWWLVGSWLWGLIFD